MKLLNKEQQLFVFTQAKEAYENGRYAGMCACIGYALTKELNHPYNDIDNYLSGFDYKTAVDMFGARKDSEHSFWWSVYDTEQRLKYFDYLIQLNK